MNFSGKGMHSVLSQSKFKEVQLKKTTQKPTNMCWSNTNANSKILALYNNIVLPLILKYTITWKPC